MCLSLHAGTGARLAKSSRSVERRGLARLVTPTEPVPEPGDDRERAVLVDAIRSINRPSLDDER